MKRIPFKCKRGHVTIKSFYSKETKGSVICRHIIENLVMTSDGGTRPWMAKFILWPVNNDRRKNSTELCKEMAVRF
jgi:cytoplasmic iron level regulating protein YaaA (DUF328/UPF0246 family)